MKNALLEFYPTPSSLIDKMIEGLNVTEINNVLEPSAGDGKIIEALNQKYENTYTHKEFNIDAIEIEPDLQAVLKSKKYNLIFNDFLKLETEKKYDLIIMNPPFSNGDKHLLKALDMQRYGGKVIAILNAETLKNPYTNTRKDLVKRLNDYGADIKYMKSEFKNAIRTTDVEIALIKVNIPYSYIESDILKNLKKAEDEKPKTAFGGNADVASGNYFQMLVDSYNLEIKAGKKLIEEYYSLSSLLENSFDDEYKQPILEMRIRNSQKNNDLINSFIYAVRLKYWKELFHSKEFMNLFTRQLQTEFMSLITDMKNYDFNMFNIIQLRISLSKSLVSALENNILECFEDLSTKYSWYAECCNNIHYYNGWSHNKAHYVNQKVIIPLDCWDNIFKRFSFKYESSCYLKDLERVFEYLDGNDRVDYQNITTILNNAERSGQSKNIQLKYFNVTFYKKGTCHINFTDKKLLKKINIYAGRQKNWLPPHYGKKAYNEMSKDEQAVIDSFEGKNSYEEVYKNAEQYLMDTSKMLKICG